MHNRPLADCKNKLLKYASRVNELSPDERIKQHRETIRLLRAKHTSNLQITCIGFIVERLHFTKLIGLPAYYPVTDLCQDFLTCARTDIGIKDYLLPTACNSNFIDGLNKENVSRLLFACFLHDANQANADRTINEETIDALFKRAILLYEKEAKPFNSNRLKNHLVELSLLSPAKEKFSNNILKESQYFKYILDAMAYYNYQAKFSVKCRTYIESFVASNTKAKISTQQKILYRYLLDELKNCNLHIELEAPMKVGSYNGDIFITNKDGSRKINIEFDGLDHFYTEMDGTTSMVNKLENIARDASLRKAGIDVIRCTENDIYFNFIDGILLGINENHQLSLLIKELQHEALEPSVLKRQFI